MYVAIFENGTELAMTAGDVNALSHDKGVTVTKAVTNGAQTAFTATVKVGDRTEEWTIVTNRYSEGEHDLFANRGRHA